MENYSTIFNNLETIEKQVCQACAEPMAVARDALTLVAVSKRQPLAKIEEAFACGVRDFGENYIQEAEKKIAQFAQASECRWHLIGPLQSNKTVTAAKIFSWVHTLDRLKIARRLGQARQDCGQDDLSACVQVNLGNEKSKGGLAPGEVPAFVTAVSEVKGIVLRGLMCIPEATSDELQIKMRFEQLATLFSQLRKTHPKLDTLSMGMSADFPLAIAAGATMIRIGTTLFGPRLA